VAVSPSPLHAGDIAPARATSRIRDDIGRSIEVLVMITTDVRAPVVMVPRRSPVVARRIRFVLGIKASSAWHGALEIFEELGHPDAKDVRGRINRLPT
jgi:hypothetical protein